VTGFTNAVDFPTVKPIQRFAGPTDVFVAKLSPTGSPIYSTHLGGNADDQGMGIAVDNSGSAYITGETESIQFPTTAGALSRSCVAVSTRGPMRQICQGGEGFIAKLSPDGTSLIYSTYLNGVGFETGRSIAVDAAGSAYVTGFTGSSDFAVVNPLQSAFGGGKYDAFILKLNPSASALEFSTFLGGRGNEGGYGIAVDRAANVYVVGYTDSSNFPTKNPMRRRTPGDSRDVFITRIASTSEANSRAIETLTGRLVAAGIPGVAAVSAVGTFHPGGPINDKSEFRAYTRSGSILDPERILVTSTSNFGAPIGSTNYPPGSTLSIDPRSNDVLIIPAEFASAGGQAVAFNGAVMLFTANSPAFLNNVNNPKAATASLPSLSNPTGISINNAFGRIWITSMPFSVKAIGLHSVLDPTGCPLANAPSKLAGGVFSNTETNRLPQLISGSMTTGALATAFLGKSPDDSGRAVFAGLHADGSIVQVHVEFGVDGLAPAGTIKPLDSRAKTRRSGMAFNWVPNPILYVCDPLQNSIVALSLRVDGKVFRVDSILRIQSSEFDLPVDIAPAIPEVVSNRFSSNTTLAADADLYVVNRGDGTIVRVKQDGRVVAKRRVKLGNDSPFGAGRLNGIAVSPDARKIWVTVSGRLRGYPEGAVIELSAFGAPGG
jgi:hypothetical protein